MAKREKVIKGLESCSGVDCTECQYGTEGHGHKDCVERLCADALALVKEQEEQKRKWLQNIADNQLSIGCVDPLTEYEQGKWDGLQMALDILTEVGEVGIRRGVCQR